MNCSGVVDDHAGRQAVVVVEEQPEEQEIVEAQTAVVSVVEGDSQEVLHQVHFTMEVDGATQEQQVSTERVYKCFIFPYRLLSVITRSKYSLFPSPAMYLKHLQL